MEIVCTARAGSNLYVRLSRSLQSPSEYHRAGRSACAPATHRCTRGGSGARMPSISLGSLQRKTRLHSYTAQAEMKHVNLLKPRLGEAPHRRMP